jgi:hypothetical protein
MNRASRSYEGQTLDPAFPTVFGSWLPAAMSRAVAASSAFAAMATAVTLAMSACTPGRAVSVNNHTDVTIRIQELSGGPPRGAYVTLAPGGGSGITISTREGECSDQLRWRAIGPDGKVISTLTKACEGDTWNVESTKQ